MLEEIKRSILNVNMTKYSRQIQLPVIDLKTEHLLKTVDDFKLYTIFEKRSILDVSQVLSSPLTIINQTFFYKKQKSYITVFWNNDS